MVVFVLRVYLVKMFEKLPKMLVFLLVVVVIA
jgi:hypothetical protein